MTPPTSGHSGFTLVEVLVALAVVAIALAALAAAGSRVIAAQQELQSRTVAFWVADNRLSELRLVEVLEPGNAEGQSRMAGRDWRWQQRIEPAPGGELWRVDVSVFDERDRPLAQQSGFVAR